MLYCGRTLENHEIDYRQNTNNTCIPGHHENSVDCPRIKETFFVDHSRDKKLSTETLMEEVEPLLEEK